MSWQQWQLLRDDMYRRKPFKGPNKAEKKITSFNRFIAEGMFENYM